MADPRPPAATADQETAAPEAIADPAGYGDPTVGAELARSISRARRADGRAETVRRLGADGARYVVGTVEEIPPGSRKVVEIDGREIGIFNVNGEYFAVLNRCPHQGGPLCSGRQTGFLRAPVPGQYELSRPGEVIRCPWHGWEFDLRTGQSWCEPSRVRVRRYEVSVQPGAAILAPGAAPEPTTEASSCADAPEPATEPGMEGLVKGPYVAETFPVSVEQQYVVVELGGRSGPHPRDCPSPMREGGGATRDLQPAPPPPRPGEGAGG